MNIWILKAQFCLVLGWPDLRKNPKWLEETDGVKSVSLGRMPSDKRLVAFPIGCSKLDVASLYINT